MSSALAKPNQELTEEERIDRKKRKRAFKLQTRRSKLQSRIRQARQRRDHALVAKTGRELRDLEDILVQQGILSQTEASKASTAEHCENIDTGTVHCSNPDGSGPLQNQARAWIEEIFLSLAARLSSQEKKAVKHTDEKEAQNKESRSLLNNMRKGTVQVEMFGNAAALLGYTRYKFQQRASLAVQSLDKIHQLPRNKDGQRRDYWLEQLYSVRVICSVGCGPGCDAIGVLAFLRAARRQQQLKNKEQQQQEPEPDASTKIIFMDWVMSQWKSTILEPLRDVLCEAISDPLETAMVQCNVRVPLLYQEEDLTKVNTDARKALFSCISTDARVAGNLLSDSNSQDSVGACSVSDTGSSPAPFQNTVDLFVVSYLLSETRDHWQAFFDDIVHTSRSGTLFLLTDPTAWQLRIFQQRYERQFIWQWLDSSMHRPELQVLEGRVGPGVLFAIKE